MRRLALVALLSVATTSGWSQTYEATPAWFEPEVYYGSFGMRVAMFDADANGYADVVITGPFYPPLSPSTTQYGAVLFYPGSSGGLSETYTWWEFGPEQGTTLGWRLATGDINGDDHDDLVFSSGSGFGNGSHQVHVRFGSVAGPGEPWNFDTGLLFGALGPTLAVGDLNGDGFDDFAATVDGLGPSEDDTGVQVFHGSASGPVAQWPLALEVETFGTSCSTTGDINGDGFSDLVVGAPWEADAGRVYLFDGSPVGLQPEPVWFNRFVSDSRRVGVSLASRGDANGDGLTDLVAGDPAGATTGFGRGVLFHGLQPFASGSAGTIDPDSSALSLRRNPAGHVVLTWGASCADHVEDYAIYRGSLGDFGSHLPVTCSTNGSTTWAVESGGGDQYYLVVPRTLDAEGSYGKDSQGNERVPSLQSCLPQSLLDC